MSDKFSFEKVTQHLQNVGFVYQGSSIYGGLSNTWDYGPLGAEMKRNIRSMWWKKFVQESPTNVGLDAAILMLSQMDAIKYFKTTIENFYNPVYDEIANYILDYTEKNDKPADVSALVSQIAASGSENSDQLENDVSTLSLEDWWPPYDAKILDECYKVIKEEKEKVNDKTLTVASLEGKDPKDKARLIADYAKRKAAKWNKNQGNGH